jgi:hypothetical protein
MIDGLLTLTQQVRDSFPTPTGFVTDGARFQDFSSSFSGVRVDGDIKSEGNVATIQLRKKSLRPARIGVFVTGINPDTNQRDAEMIFTNRMYRRMATYQVQLSSRQIPIQFGDLEVAIVSYSIGGIAPRVEAGSEFDGENLPLTVWRFAKVTFPQSEFFQVDSGPASTSRGAINPILLTRRF